MIHVKCERLETVNRKWQYQQEIGLCLQLCRWSPLGPAWRLFNMTHFNSTWGARSWLHTNTNTHTHMHISRHRHMCVHTHPHIHTNVHLRIIHFILNIPAGFERKTVFFQILEGDMFLIIDMQVRISILCCLTWAGRH